MAIKLGPRQEAWPRPLCKGDDFARTQIHIGTPCAIIPASQTIKGTAGGGCIYGTSRRTRCEIDLPYCRSRVLPWRLSEKTHWRNFQHLTPKMKRISLMVLFSGEASIIKSEHIPLAWGLRKGMKFRHHRYHDNHCTAVCSWARRNG